LIVWHKLKAHYGAPSAHYCQKHEPCLYAVKGSANFIGPSNEVTVWEIDQPSRNEFHPTQKPIECMARAIRNHDAPLIYDPFLGSGTTLIAAEQLGRKCYGMEISPAYCDVIVKRWEMLTGKKATRA
jgi:DNA modification methylase